MINRTFILINLILLSTVATAGEKRYRVEILVLSHLQHEAVPSEEVYLRDFSSSLDFLKPEEDDAENIVEGDKADEDQATFAENTNTGLLVQDESVGDQTELDGSGDAAPGQELSSDLLLEEDEADEPWADVLPVKEMSDVMREAWRRLRLGALFRPEQYLSWEQSADEPFPSLRIHDLEIVLVEDLYAELRETFALESDGQEIEVNEEEEETKDKPVVFTDQGELLPGNYLQELIKEFEEEPELPDPTSFYRIDGTALLKRTRFLHLNFDLELRQAVFDQDLLTTAPLLNNDDDSDEPTLPLPTSYLIHKLKQSRQVKSQRMEYFDSPVLGVLAWITPFETEDEAEDEAEVLSN